MKNARTIVFILFVISQVIVAGCAVQKAPSGGEIDKTPPELIQSIPPSETTLFKDDKIELYFNEYLAFKNLSQQLLIAPEINPEPKIEIRGKKIIINLKDSLLPNTTYLFQFGNSIADITEGNTISSFDYVFSTGKYLDSLGFTGKVIDEYSAQPSKSAVLLLYENLDDSAIYKEKPKYFSRVNDQGIFKFNYLHQGRYALFALEDANSNKKYDFGENIGFLDSTWVLPADSIVLEMHLFKEKTGIKLLDKKQYNQNSMGLKVSEQPRSIDISSMNSNILVNTVIKKDSILVFYTSDTLQSGDLIVKANDIVLDTIFVKTSNLEHKKIKAELHNEFNTTGNIYISLNQPLIALDTAAIMLYKDSIYKPLELNISKIPGNGLEYLIDFDFMPGSKYTLQIEEGALEGFLKSTNDSMGFTILTKKEEELANIEFDVSNEMHKQIIFELISQKNEVLRSKTVNSSEKLIFKGLLPGNYKLRWIYDTNRNGKWDTGQLYEKKHPEKVFYFAKPISLKANWEMVESIEIE